MCVVAVPSKGTVATPSLFRQRWEAPYIVQAKARVDVPRTKGMVKRALRSAKRHVAILAGRMEAARPIISS